MWENAVWTNGKRKIIGRWIYNYPSDTFKVVLDKKEPISGLQIEFVVYADTPEWDKWKLWRKGNDD